MQRLTLRRPDDWHLHLRDGPILRAVLPYTARVFRRAICMPNLTPPVRTVDQALAYRERILTALPEGLDFEPLMVLYLTDTTPPQEVVRGKATGLIHGVKLYPAGATTNSDAGVTDIARVDRVLAELAEVGLPLLVHGEVTASHVDLFDREAVFIDQVLRPLIARHSGLRVVFEHLTTAEGVAFVQERDDDRVAATLTAHHLLLDRNALFEGGLRPHRYCLPVLKRARHREALLAAATSGDPRFFLGTDSAPHPIGAKESACGCAGMFTAPDALGLYAEAFESAGALDKLEAFASEHGPRWYGMPLNEGRVTLERSPRRVEPVLPMGEEQVVPMRAGGAVQWQVVA
ncbi:MAG: dihydroorotase [Deltaproteobacteria bacterium]|nr:MAG: dihydroorotase [Deltaproteobacteria bacterium]